MKKILMMLMSVALATFAWAAFGDIYSITPLSEKGKVYKAGETVKFQVRLLSRNYDTPNPLAYQLVYTGSGTEAEDKVSNPLQLGIVVSGQLRGAKIVEVKPAAISGDQTVNPYTDLICEYVVHPGDIASPIKLALNGSTENNPIVPVSADAVNNSGYILINGNKWNLRIKGQTTSASLRFVSSSSANMAKGFWPQLGTTVVDYNLAQANFQVNAPLDPIEYLTWDEATKSLVAATNTSYTVVTKDTATFDDGKWYVVNSTIERGAITVNGAAHLILCDGASLKVTGGAKKAGIEVAEGKSLTIYGQSEGTGKLDAKSGDYGAAIGGRDMSACGNVTINGGTVAANGGVCAAGIGGGFAGRGGTLTINGGKVTTIGGLGGAGIGGGYGADGGMLTINGGTVTSNGGCGGRYSAAGIGAGCVDSEALSDGTVTFAEGVELSVYAGDDEASAEEVTMDNFEKNHSARFVAINRDPLVYLTWDDEKKELAEANSFVYEVVTKDTATFESNKWYVVTNTVERGTIKVNGEAHLILCDGASLTATAVDGEAGINVNSINKSLTIYGQSEGTGALIANAGIDGAGIGGSECLPCGTITINGGTITANGSPRGAGIGGGWCAYGYVVTINGGTITANGGTDSAGIGGGWGGRGGTVTINGGKITASSLGGAGIGAGTGPSSTNHGAITFAEGVEFSIVAGDDEASATEKTVTEYMAGRSAKYVKIGPRPKVTVDEIVEGEDWTKFDVAYTLDNLEEGVDYKVLIEVTAGGVTKSITNATDIVIGSFTNSVDTVKLFGSKVFDGEAKVVLSLEADGEIVASSTEETVSILPPPVEYLDWNGTEFVAATNQAYEVVTAETKTFEDKTWYVVTNTIERAGIIVDGEAHLILCDGAKLKVTGDTNKDKAGIEVPENSALTIYGQSEGTGVLEATGGGESAAGIGGRYDGTCGTITINGGTITAISTYGSAGIGGGYLSQCAATITINGGKVKATGGDEGAGIGSGGSGDYSTVPGVDSDIITINGGEIEAIGGGLGAGIGSGAVGSAAKITINGGTITATGGMYGAGIGSGYAGQLTSVTINGGAITASTVPDKGAEAIGKGLAVMPAETVTLGSAMTSKYVWAGKSATKGETMTTAAFAADHSAAYVEIPVETYEVAYDANGATGTMSNSVFAVSKEVTLKKNAFTALGYDFAGWTTNGTDVVYADEAKDTDFATTNATLTLYAKWNASTNSVTATSYEALTNTIATAGLQQSNLPITIDFTSDVAIEGAALPTLPTGTGFDGLKYVGDDEGGSNLELADGVLYGSAMRGEVTVDALQLMQLANGGTISSFQAISEGETTVTNAVVMLLGDDGKAYFNDTDDVDEMIADILAADPRPTCVKLFEVKGAMVTFEAMGGILENGTESTTYLCLPDTGYVLPDKVERDGYKLKGWYTSWKSGANEITNNQVIVNYAPQSLYAQWTSTAPTQSSKGELHLPDIVNGTPTTTIADANYRNNTTLKNVITPVHLESIGQYAFSGCTALNKLMITSARKYSDLTPITVQVGKNAFSGCSSLEELNVGGKVAFGQSAFQNCAKLKKLVFRGDEAITYGTSAFYRCGYNNGTGELKVYMSDEFKTANTALVNDLKKWNTTLQIIPMTLTLPVKGIENINIDFSKLSTTRKLAVLVQTTVQGVPEADNVDIEYSTTLGGTWKPLQGEKTAYPDGTVLIEVTAPTGQSGFFRAVVK